MNNDGKMNGEIPAEVEKLRVFYVRQKSADFDRRIVVLSLWKKLWKL